MSRRSNYLHVVYRDVMPRTQQALLRFAREYDLRVPTVQIGGRRVPMHSAILATHRVPYDMGQAVDDTVGRLLLPSFALQSVALHPASGGDTTVVAHLMGKGLTEFVEQAKDVQEQLSAPTAQVIPTITLGHSSLSVDDLRQRLPRDELIRCQLGDIALGPLVYAIRPPKSPKNKVTTDH